MICNACELNSSSQPREHPAADPRPTISTVVDLTRTPETSLQTSPGLNNISISQYRNQCICHAHECNNNNNNINIIINSHHQCRYHYQSIPSVSTTLSIHTININMPVMINQHMMYNFSIKNTMSSVSYLISKTRVK